MILSYPILVFDSINKYNSINFLLFVISIVVVVFSINNFKKNNINSYNIFLVVYFISLFFNTLNLSTKQFLKTPEDLYYFLLAPLLLFLILNIVEKFNYKKIRLKNIVKFNPDTIYIILIIIYVGLKLYIGMKVGFRIFDYDDITKIAHGKDYIIPGISGISTIAQWLLIIFIPYVKKKYVVIAVILIIVLSGIMHVKRGDIIRVLIFILLYWVYIQIELQNMTKTKLFKLFLSVAVFIAIFVLFGEYRLEARGGVNDQILEYLGSRVNSVTIAWLYGYMSFNFEILKLYYTFVPSYEMIHLHEVFGANFERESIGLAVTISGFNAGTFIQPFLLDYGKLFYIELLVFAFIVATIVIITKKLNFIGLYIFLIMLMSLLIFGDYLLNRAMIMSIMIAIIIFPFMRIKSIKVENENNN